MEIDSTEANGNSGLDDALGGGNGAGINNDENGGDGGIRNIYTLQNEVNSLQSRLNQLQVSNVDHIKMEMEWLRPAKLNKLR